MFSFLGKLVEFRASVIMVLNSKRRYADENDGKSAARLEWKVAIIRIFVYTNMMSNNGKANIKHSHLVLNRFVNDELAITSIPHKLKFVRVFVVVVAVAMLRSVVTIIASIDRGAREWDRDSVIPDREMFMPYLYWYEMRSCGFRTFWIAAVYSFIDHIPELVALWMLNMKAST